MPSLISVLCIPTRAAFRRMVKRPPIGPDAQFALGLLYTVGLGVAADSKEAAHWYRLSAEQGSVRSQSSLGFMYSEGRGVPQDYVQAHMWFNLAGAGGDADGIDARPAIENLMKADQIAEAERLAREWKPKKTQ